MTNSGNPYQGIPTIGGYQYLNPFYLRQQEEERRKRELEAYNNQANIWKRLLKAGANFCGNEINEDELNERFSIEHRQKVQEEMSHFELLGQLQEQAMREQLYYEQKAKERIEEIKQANEEINSKGYTLYSWLIGPETDKYIETIKQRNSKQDVAKLYDPNGYSKLLGIHNNSYQALNQNVTIDDMEIGLPPQLRSSEAARRRQKFMEAILSTDKGW